MVSTIGFLPFQPTRNIVLLSLYGVRSRIIVIQHTICYFAFSKRSRRSAMDVWNNQINQQASKALRKAGLEPHPKILPAIERMNWRLDQGGLIVDPAVEDTTRAMLRWKPKAAMNYLLGDLPQGEERELPPENLTDPEKLAEELLGLLETAESGHNPHYMGAAR